MHKFAVGDEVTCVAAVSRWFLQDGTIMKIRSNDDYDVDFGNGIFPFHETELELKQNTSPLQAFIPNAALTNALKAKPESKIVECKCGHASKKLPTHEGWCSVGWASADA